MNKLPGCIQFFWPVSDKLHSKYKTVLQGVSSSRYAGSPVSQESIKTCTQTNQNIKKQNKHPQQPTTKQQPTHTNKWPDPETPAACTTRDSTVKWWRSEGNRRQRKVVRGILAHMERRPIHGVEDLPVRHEMCNKWDLWWTLQQLSINKSSYLNRSSDIW